MTSSETSTRALVLGGGGATGIAWELGIVRGLHDAGVDVRRADMIISPVGPSWRASSPLN